MARRTRPDRGASDLHQALADWHDDRARHFRGVFGRVSQLHEERAAICRTGAAITVDAIELTGALHLLGDSSWRTYQHRAGTPAADPDARWRVNEAGRISGPYLASGTAA